MQDTIENRKTVRDELMSIHKRLAEIAGMLDTVDHDAGRALHGARDEIHAAFRILRQPPMDEPIFMTNQNKIKATRIELVHATGPSDVGVGFQNGIIAGTTAVHSDYQAASEQLVAWQDVNPLGRPEQIDWTVTFENGQKVDGTLQIIRPIDRPAVEPNFIKSLTSGLIRLTGDDPDAKKFQELVDKTGSKRRKAQSMLDSYDFGLEPEQPSLGR